MKFSQCIIALQESRATAAMCTRLSPTWLIVHVDLDDAGRGALAKRLNQLTGNDRRVTIGTYDGSAEGPSS